MYRLYSGLWQENVQLTIRNSPSWSASCFFLCVFFSYMQRCCRSYGEWLTEWEGLVAPPHLEFCYLIGHRDLPWPYGWEDRSHFWIRPGKCNLAAFFKRKIIISSRLGPAKAASKRWLWAGWGGAEMLVANAGRRDSQPSPFCYFSPPSNGWYFLSLFSKFFQYLVHLNNWSSSPYSPASFDIWCRPNGPSRSCSTVQKTATAAQLGSILV